MNTYRLFVDMSVFFKINQIFVFLILLLFLTVTKYHKSRSKLKKKNCKKVFVFVIWICSKQIVETLSGRVYFYIIWIIFACWDKSAFLILHPRGSDQLFSESQVACLLIFFSLIVTHVGTLNWFNFGSFCHLYRRCHGKYFRLAY